MSARTATRPREDGPPSVRRFVLSFCLAFLVLEAVVLLVLWEARWFDPYAVWNARVTALCLRPFLEGVQAIDGVLTAPGFSIQVRPGCDGYQASAVLLAGVLAFPASRARKWQGALLGTALLLALNPLRLGALLWTGVHHPGSFDLMHLEVLPALYVLAALVTLFAWILWARP